MTNNMGEVKMSDEGNAINRFEEAVLRAKQTKDTVDLERAHLCSASCSDPQLRLIMAGVIHGIATLDDVLELISHSRAEVVLS